MWRPKYFTFLAKKATRSIKLLPNILTVKTTIVAQDGKG